MQQPTKAIVAAAGAAIILTAAPVAAQHGGGGAHGGSGHASGSAHGGSHTRGGGHNTPPPPVVHPAVPHTTVARPPLDRHVVVPSPRSSSGSLDTLGLGVGSFPYPHGYPRYHSGLPGFYGSASRYYGSSAGSHGHARLRLLGAPRDAQVFVGGVYVGIVDDFDGRLQHLELTPGVHRIEIRARTFAPIAFDVNAIDGRTISYRVQMVRERP